MPSFSAMLGSSSSDSGGGAGEAEGLGAACADGKRGAGAGSDSSREPRLTWVPLEMSGAWTGSGAGVSSTSECLPVVQGSMARNSSNVRTRGLQHFQPGMTFSTNPDYCSTEAMRTHLSAPHGRRVGRDGRHTPRRRSHRPCRSLCGHISSPYCWTVRIGERVLEWASCAVFVFLRAPDGN